MTAFFLTLTFTLLVLFWLCQKIERHHASSSRPLPLEQDDSFIASYDPSKSCLFQQRERSYVVDFLSIQLQSPHRLSSPISKSSSLGPSTWEASEIFKASNIHEASLLGWGRLCHIIFWIHAHQIEPFGACNGMAAVS